MKSAIGDHKKSFALIVINDDFTAPPSYEECVQGRVNINEEDDSQYTQGQLSYAPVYPYYTSLAGLPPTSPPAYGEGNAV